MTRICANEQAIKMCSNKNSQTKNERSDENY